MNEPTAPARFERCPKCQHHPLPADQGLPAACPGCGVILAKLKDAGTRSQARPRQPPAVWEGDESTPRWHEGLLACEPPFDAVGWWARALLWAGFVIWGWRLIGMDHRMGEMGESFLHGPLLVFHEAGHVLFRPFGEWLGVLGGTLGQLIMPAVMGGALLIKNRDPFGASLGLWLLGVSLLDIAPYAYDALVPQLMLLSGRTGEEGGHDWIYLLNSVGALPKAQAIGTLIHRLGALVVILSWIGGGWMLMRHWQARRAGDGHTER